MTPKNSRLRSVSAQTTRQSLHDRQAGSDGDRRLDQAAEPSPASIESNALDQHEELSRMIQNIRGVIHGMSCIAYLHEETGEGRLQELQDLAEVGEELCTAAFRRSYDLWNVFVQWKPSRKNAAEQGGSYA